MPDGSTATHCTESPKLTIEYSQAQVELVKKAEVELVKTHLKVIAEHCRDYKTHHDHWEICKPPSPNLVGASPHTDSN